MAVNTQYFPNEKAARVGHLIDTNNTDYADVQTYHTYIPMAQDGFFYFLARVVIQATTVTVFGSNDDPSVANASAEWVDISTTVLGAANITATATVAPTAVIRWGRLRITALTTNATNALDVYLSLTKA